MVIIRSASWRFSELAEPENLPRGAENEHISGIRVIQGCDCGVHPGRRAENRPHSADSVQRGDAGDLQPPRLHGLFHYVVSKKSSPHPRALPENRMLEGGSALLSILASRAGNGAGAPKGGMEQLLEDSKEKQQEILLFQEE
ncbi:uncharacterized protein LOC118530557 isoform X8 [Halichoerus grypus]